MPSRRQQVRPPQAQPRLRHRLGPAPRRPHQGLPHPDLRHRRRRGRLLLQPLQLQQPGHGRAAPGLAPRRAARQPPAGHGAASRHGRAAASGDGAGQGRGPLRQDIRRVLIWLAPRRTESSLRQGARRAAGVTSTVKPDIEDLWRSGGDPKRGRSHMRARKHTHTHKHKIGCVGRCIVGGSSFYLCVCARARVCVFVCMFVYVFVCMCVCVCARACQCVRFPPTGGRAAGGGNPIRGKGGKSPPPPLWPVQGGLVGSHARICRLLVDQGRLVVSRRSGPPRGFS